MRRRLFNPLTVNSAINFGAKNNVVMKDKNYFSACHKKNIFKSGFEQKHKIGA